MAELTAIPPEKLPGFVAYPHRHWLYVETRPGTTVGSLLQGILEAALRGSPGQESAIIEERAVIRLPSGERLQGVSFKASHPAVAPGVRDYAVGHSLKWGRLVDVVLQLEDGHAVSLAECNCFAY
jgi:hypothetical protein